MHDLVDPAVVVPEPEIAGLDAQGFAHIEKRIVDQFLRHHAERAARLPVVAHHVMPHDGGVAGIGAGEPGENGNQRGFAGAVGPQQAKKLARLNVERNPVERLGGAKAFAQIAHADCRAGRIHSGSNADTP